MAANINRVVLVGNLTRDPEVRQTPSGTSVCSLRIAVNSRRRDEAGQWTDKPNYFSVSVFGNQAESCAQYLSKGRPVAVDGRLDWREWQTQDGQKRQAGSAETIVDVYHRDAGTAAGQHRIQRNDAALGNARADRRRNADYRGTQQTGNHGRQCPIHSCDHDAHARRRQLRQDRLQTMDAGHADVEVSRGWNSHRIESSRRLESDRDVSGAGSDDSLDVFLRPAPLTTNHSPLTAFIESPPRDPTL